jgi:hypothetical protein
MTVRFSDPMQLIEHALASREEAWLAAEQALFEAADLGVALEAASASHGDPVGRQMARTATDTDAAGRDALAKATAYLDGAARKFARTPAGSPPIGGVAANLSATFGAQLAGPLALRLVQQPQTPHWRAMATLAYLDQHRDPSIVPSLARFVFQTTRGPEQELAIRILGSIGGPTVASAFRAERDRAAATGRRLDPALAALVDGKGSPGVA